MVQVEYAIEAIKLGSTAIGIQTSEGVSPCSTALVFLLLKGPPRWFLSWFLLICPFKVILAVEKRITSPLMEPTSIGELKL